MPPDALTCRHAIARAQLASRSHCTVPRSQHLPAPLRNTSQPLDHVWITGAALQRAYDNYSALSLSCGTQRRYGSNVPGPLEARRRLAKRRMVMAMPGASHETNSLSSWWADVRRWVKAAQMSLGTEVYPWENLQWQPPWSTPGLSIREQDPTASAALPREISRTNPSTGNAKVTIEAAAGSELRPSFAESVEQCRTLRDLKVACTALASQHEAGENRADITLSHLFSCGAYLHERDDAEWSTNLRMVLANCFLVLRDGQNAFNAVSNWTVRLIDSLVLREQLHCILPTWFSALQSVETDDKHAPVLEHAALTAIRTNPHARAQPITAAAEGGELAPPQEIAHCFAAFDNFSLGRMSILGATYHLPLESTRLRKRMLALYDERAAKCSSDDMREVVSALLWCLQASDSRSTWRMWSWLYIFVYKLGGERKLLDLLGHVRAQAPRAKWSDATMTRLLRMLAKTDPEAAVRIFKAGALHVQDPSPIITELMKHEQIPPHDIMYLMWHGQHIKKVMSDSIDRGCRLSPHRVRLVSDMALNFMARKGDSPRTAFRNVHNCYTYLVKHGAPVTQEVAEALCVSGVIRTLQAREWLSTIKFAWILKIIREVEGPETAARLDQTTYEWRERVRNHVLEERRRRYRRGEMLVPSLAMVKVPIKQYGLRIKDLSRRKGQPRTKQRFDWFPSWKLVWVPRHGH